jgi:branched-chain amino acid transport system permease protein
MHSMPMAFAAAVAIIAGLQFLFHRTGLGRVFRATSDDGEIGQIMGLDKRRVFAAVLGAAGALLAIRSKFDPFMAPRG